MKRIFWVNHRGDRQLWLKVAGVTIALLLLMLLASCRIPQVKAEDRIFLNLSLDFLGDYQLPKLEFEGTTVGGLSGIVYDRQRDRFYAVSDDRSTIAPAHFYTLKLIVDADRPNGETEEAIEIQAVEVEKVTTLTGEDGNPYATGTIDFEGIALSPRQTVFIASEGVTEEGIPPFIDEFDLETGQWRRRLPIPVRYVPNEIDGQPIGVQDNRGFESLTIDAEGSAPNSLEPFRLFSATESALRQDLPDPAAPDNPTQTPVRFLHYLVGESLPTLLAEHVYFVEPLPAGAEDIGLTDLVTLEQGGHLLGLERSFGRSVGVNAKIFQLATGGATDVSGFPSLKGLTNLTSIYKELLLDLGELDIPLDNLEGMTLGPRLPDGSQSLLLVSDDNFNDLQVNQFLLFRLR
ncbi:MAG: esterase-like activity of phytase family protein [Cyanobacteria bacterium CRU_2_1]|nr:esterase-like activity of phytase family protein [Cyanobacteria bacterium RU_5_0]NJR59299.1 esterase-like activity of phytase family protein [Cyanobacteria bacterium CRU_2_1]